MARNLKPSISYRARDDALTRDGHRCVAVEQYGELTVRCPTRRGLSVHHKVRPEDGGDPYALENLLTLCRAHHQRLHLVHEPLRQARRRRVPHRPNAGAYLPFSRAA